jgi:hypothetical protein
VFLLYGVRQRSTDKQNHWLHCNVVYFSPYSFSWRTSLKTGELNGT